MLVNTHIHTVKDLVNEAAREYNDRDYLRFVENGEIKGISFKQFKEDTDAIAAWTLRQNKKLGKRVKIAMLSPNSSLYTKMLIGIMCGNGVSVPIDPQIEQENLYNCLNKAEVDIIIYDKSIPLDRKTIFNKCKNIQNILHFEDNENRDCSDIIEKYKGSEACAEISEKDCAVIIFTSGTTGEEKGVMLSHANLIDTVFNSYYDDAVQLSILPIHHAFGLKADFLLALGIGSTTCFIEGMDKLGEALQMYQPSSLNMVPMIANALYTKIVMLSQQTRKTLEECRELVFGKNIKQIITGGAHLPSELVDKYHAIGVFIAQGYGMTECSPTISTPIMNRADKAYTAGQLVNGCIARVVDGELQIKSPSVMMGYVNAPELTAQIITEDGWLRTGDVGYADEENFVHITGRKKNLIILSNGENVAPEQIENMLLDHQLIEECLVYGEGNQIVAELYPNDGYAKLNHIDNVPHKLELIVNEVNSGLTSYKKFMKHIVRKNPFIKTGSNKIVRNQRAKSEDIATVESNKLNLPISEMQVKLYDIVSGVLGHNEFGIDTDFFSVGLDSFGCIMTLTELQDRLNFTVELNELISNCTIEKLERLYIKKNTNKTVDYSLRTVYPLTNLQKSMAYVLRGNTTTNIPFLYKIDSSVDLIRLKASIEKLFDIHPILKGIIQPFEDKGLAMFRNDDLKIDIPIYEMSEEEWLEEKDELIKPYMYTPGEPLYHIGIYSVEGDNFLFFDVAHVISDGMTLGILLRNLDRLYKGVEIPKESYSFYEYMLDEQFRAENGLRADSELYFKRLMNGLKLERSILNKKDNGDLTVEKNAAIHGAFKDLSYDRAVKYCNKNGVSKNILFLTAFNYCVSVFNDKDDVITSSVHNGRTDSRWGTLAGALFKVYNYRYTMKKYQKITDMFNESAKQVMETMCSYISNIRADEMFFQYQGDIFTGIKIGDKPVEHIQLQLDSLPFHLMVYENTNQFTYELRYWENRFDEKQLKVFIDVFESVIRGMIRTDSVNNLRSYIPKKYLVADKEVVGVDGLVTILNRYDDIQPIAGWGRLLVNGVDTGKIARVTIDNEIDYLENSGRTIMQETLTGKYFINMEKLERGLEQIDGIEKAEVCFTFGDNNRLVITANIEANDTIDENRVVEYITKDCNIVTHAVKVILN